MGIKDTKKIYENRIEISRVKNISKILIVYIRYQQALSISEKKHLLTHEGIEVK